VLNQEKGFQYQFAPGSVQYSEQFLEMYQSIVDRTSEDHIFRLLVQFLEEIFTEAGHHKISLLPETKKDFRCPGCGVNHEVRDFIRAILLHLIDQLEMDDTFVKFLYRNDFVSEEGYNELRKVVFSKSHVPSLKRKKRLVNLRIVSINEGLENRLGRFLAIDKEGTIGHGTIDNSLLHTIHSEAIIECDPSVFDINTDGGFYVALYSGDSIKIMKDDPSFPKLQQILTKIEYIKKLIGTDAFDTHGNIYVIEAIILLAPKLVERFIHGRSVQALDTIIGDETGEIRLVGQYRHPEELQVGDRIIVIGAFEKPTIETFHHDLIFTDIELRLSPYGSIIKKERK
jgi:hypothetical protein